MISPTDDALAVTTFPCLLSGSQLLPGYSGWDPQHRDCLPGI